MNDSVYSEASSTQNSDVGTSDVTPLTPADHDTQFHDPVTHLDSDLQLQHPVTQNPYAPLSSSKKASIIKLEKPVFTVQHSIEISRRNPAPTHPTTTSTTSKTLRSSEPTPTVTSDLLNNNNNNNNKNKKESVPWPNFYYELPSLEDSLSESMESNVATFGGVASNTVRPFNHSFPWSPTTQSESESESESDYEDWNDSDQVSNTI